MCTCIKSCVLVKTEVKIKLEYVPSYESFPLYFISLQFFIWDRNYHKSSPLPHESKWLDQVVLDVRLGSNYGIPSCEFFPIYFISLQFFVYDSNYHGSSTDESKWLDQVGSSWVRFWLNAKLCSKNGMPSCEFFPIYFISFQFFIYDSNYHGSSTDESKWLDQVGSSWVRLG